MNTLPWVCLSCDATFPNDQKDEFEAHLKDMGHVTEEAGLSTIDGAGAPNPKDLV